MRKKRLNCANCCLRFDSDLQQTLFGQKGRERVGGRVVLACVSVCLNASHFIPNKVQKNFSMSRINMHFSFV